MTACLKQFGMSSAFGTDHVRHKQSMAQLVLSDLTTKAGVELLMQWLPNPNVIGIFLAPPCGTASRARAIPMKRKRPGDPPAPKPLRSDAFPKEIPGMSFFRSRQDLQGQQTIPLDCICFTVFQTCRYGGTRAKRTMLAFNTEEFLTINKMCNGVSAQHRHEKWGPGPEQRFATALEAAYPMTLAR